MSTFDLIVRVAHVCGAAIWIGAAFFGAWFLIPALGDVGPDGGKVMLAVQKRGWIIAMPIIATVTILSGFWLYRRYMGDPGHAAKALGFGGAIGVLAYVLGIVVVSRSMANATALAAKAMALPDGAERSALQNTIRQMRQRGLLFGRIVSLLIIVAAILMTIAMYV